MMMTEMEMMKLQNGSDVRGVAVAGVPGEEVTLTPEAVNRIAAAFVSFLAKKLGKEPAALRIAVGHDSRISASLLQEAVFSGLTACAADVFKCDLASTPAMFMSIVFSQTQMDGAIMLTASHLPYNRNGMKFFTVEGGLEKTDIRALLAQAAALPEQHGDLAQVHALNLMELYAEHLCQTISMRLGVPVEEKPLQGMHIVVDAGNGSGGFFVTDVLDVLGADTTGSQFLEPDGMFPNHIPNPENAAAMAAIP